MNTYAKYHKSVDLTSADFSQDFDYLYITGAGNLTITDNAGVSVTITGVAAKSWHLAGGSKVVRATTTATGIIAYRCGQDFSI